MKIPISQTTLISILLILLSCKSEEPKTPPARDFTRGTPQAEEPYINPTLPFYPLMEDVPCSFTLKTTQLKDFTSHFYSANLTNWFSYTAEVVDTVVKIEVRLREAYNFIKSFENNSYCRRNGYRFNNGENFLKAVFNPDTLLAASAPMLTKEACMSLFQVPDSVYLFHSFEQYAKPSHVRRSEYIQHIFYNHSKSSYTLMTLDTIGQLLDSINLCANQDTNKSYEFRFALPGALQVIQHTTTRKRGYAFQTDIEEINRIYTTPDGRIYDWTDTIFSPAVHCQALRPDSVLAWRDYSIMVEKAIPLPLGMESKLKKYLTDSYNSSTRDIYLMGGPWMDLFYILNSIPFDGSAPGIVLGGGYFVYLALFDQHGNVEDAKSMSRVEVTNSEDRWKSTEAKLGADQHIYLINDYPARDTVDEWKIERSKIISLRHQQPLLTVPYGYLDQYFPFKDVNVFNMEEIGHRYEDLLSFPDSIYACIAEAAKLNGCYLPTGNYSITHASNGLTYLTFLRDGGISSTLSMMIIDQNNILRSGQFDLASGGGDEGDYWGSNGYFINDSTYFQTCQSGSSFEAVNDSSAIVWRISSTGKISLDPTPSQYFKVPNPN